MKLRFDVAALVAEIAAVKAAAKHRPCYEGETGPGLWLVGDDGVYLMGNHERPMPPKGEKYAVIYAVEVDPTRLAFDNWWDAKQRSFGGDDGVEFLPLDSMEAWVENAVQYGAKHAVLEVSATGISALFLQAERVH